MARLHAAVDDAAAPDSAGGNPGPGTTATPPQPHRVISASEMEPMLRQRLLDPPLRPGDAAAIDRFPGVRQIGRGGMGVVFLCRHPVSDAEVAIKSSARSL